MLYNKNDIKTALDGEIISIDDKYEYNIDKAVFDNREIEENTLFIAKKGERTDGHNFILDTLKSRNDTIILAEHIPNDIEKNSRVIIVKDTKRAFEKLAIFSQKRLQNPIIGITGSVGKTSTKDMFYHCLSKFGNAYCNEQSFNNYIGVLTTLTNTPKETKFPIYEMGISSPGEMEIIEKLIKPEISIILNVKQAHFGYFSSEKEIAEEKAKIIGNDTKVVILNKDNKWYNLLEEIALKKNKKIITFGKERKDVNVSLSEHKIVKDKAIVKYCVNGKNYEKIISNIDYNIAYNAQSLLCLASYFALEINEILGAMSSFETTRGRNNIEYTKYEKNGNVVNLTIINGSYNAVNPDVFISGLKLMDDIYKQGKNSRKVCIWGDMLEAGNKSLEFHLGLKKYLINYKIDLFITVGQYMNQLNDLLENSSINRVKFNTIDDITDNIKNYLKNNDLVFIKSSKGIKTYKVLNSIVEDKMKLFV